MTIHNPIIQFTCKTMHQIPFATAVPGEEPGQGDSIERANRKMDEHVGGGAKRRGVNFISGEDKKRGVIGVGWGWGRFAVLYFNDRGPREAPGAGR